MVAERGSNARFHGVVDGFGPSDQLSGWAKPLTPGDPVEASALTVTVHADGEIIGKAAVDELRRDLGGHHGFTIRLARPVGKAAIVEGRVRVEVSDAGQGACELVFYSGLVERLREPPAGKPDSEILSQIRRCMGEAGEDLKRRIADVLPYLSTPTADLMLPAAPGNELSMVGIKPGLRSANEIAVAGREGHLFVLRGTNDLKSQYDQDPDDPAVGEKADAWIRVFEERRRAIAERGLRYMQMIVPEKSSVLPELYPLPLRHPTAILSRIGAGMAERPALAAHYLDCHAELRRHPDRPGLFLKVDTHMSVPGSKAVFEMILARMGHPETLSVDLSSRLLRAGDLGGMFPGAAMHEFVALPDSARMASQEAGLVAVEAFRPPGGAHLGSRFVWRNEGAPLPFTVVAFANSFFERGTTALGLSWWAARWFREFHFLWSPEIDFGYVDRLRPDWVICQTIERFLPMTPSV